MEYIRQQYNILKDRILEPRKFIQVLAGPRQVGKSTLITQVLRSISIPHSIEVADGVDPTIVTGYTEYGRRLESLWKSAKNENILL